MKKQTLNGAAVTEAQIHEWADEAEAGFPVEHLRKRGRPLLGEVPATVVPVRIEADLLDALEERAEAHHISRSEAIRAAIRVWIGNA